MTSAVGFTGTSVSALYQILAEKDQPDGYVGLDSNGKIPVQYLPDSIPTDFTNVELKTNKNQPNGYPGLDAGGQLAASVIPPGSYILSSDKGAVNGVAPLDGTGTIYFTDLPVGTTSTSVAVGNHTHTGEFVREDQRNLPNGFAGLDAVSKIAIAQIPTGSASNTVAIGNHVHAGLYEPIINPKRTAFNKDFGAGAGQVAEGNHSHPGQYEPIISPKRSAFNKDFGTSSTDVAAGNHTHAGQYEPIIGFKRSAFNKDFGTGAGQVAAGNHTHAGLYEPIISPKRTAFNKDFGTGIGQVAEGNHTHGGIYLAKKTEAQMVAADGVGYGWNDIDGDQGLASGVEATMLKNSHQAGAGGFVFTDYKQGTAKNVAWLRPDFCNYYSPLRVNNNEVWHDGNTPKGRGTFSLQPLGTGWTSSSSGKWSRFGDIVIIYSVSLSFSGTIPTNSLLDLDGLPFTADGTNWTNLRIINAINMPANYSLTGYCNGTVFRPIYITGTTTENRTFSSDNIQSNTEFLFSCVYVTFD